MLPMCLRTVQLRGLHVSSCLLAAAPRERTVVVPAPEEGDCTLERESHVPEAPQALLEIVLAPASC